MKKKIKISVIIKYAVLIVISLLFLVPFMAMLFNAFKAEKEILGYPPTFFPKEITLANFQAIFGNSSMNLLRSLGNSIFVAVSRTVLIIYFSALWGYTFSKLKFRGRGILFGVALSAMMIPLAVILLPLYQEMIWLKLNGSLLSLIIIVNGTTSYGIFIMRQFMMGLPNELIEAGRIDGCNEFQIFHKIIFPMLKNAISAASIIVFLYVWNDFLWPFMMIDAPEKQTITVAMNYLNGRNFIQYGQLMAAATIALLPILVIYFIFQNRFTQGLSFSGSKE